MPDGVLLKAQAKGIGGGTIVLSNGWYGSCVVVGCLSLFILHKGLMIGKHLG